MQSLDVISVNIWQILISLANLLIMFLILKKFLFKPVQNVLAERKAQVDSLYSDAERDKQEAAATRQEYDRRLGQAREEADALMRSAQVSAREKGEAIVAEANAQARHLKHKAEEEAEQTKRQMLRDVRGEISDMVVDAAAAVVGREINGQDQKDLIDEFIRNVGDRQ